MIVVILFESGIEIGGIYRRHLMCLAINADGGQVDEGAYTSPGKAGGYLQQFLVLVHAIVAGRLRGVETGQHKGCGEPDDGLRGAHCHGRYLRRSTRTRLLHLSHSNRNEFPCCQYISGQRRDFIPGFEQSDMRALSALDALAIENSVVNGGSLTPQKAKSAKSTRFVYGRYLPLKQGPCRSNLIRNRLCLYP